MKIRDDAGDEGGDGSDIGHQMVVTKEVKAVMMVVTKEVVAVMMVVTKEVHPPPGPGLARGYLQREDPPSLLHLIHPPPSYTSYTLLPPTSHTPPSLLHLIHLPSSYTS